MKLAMCRLCSRSAWDMNAMCDRLMDDLQTGQEHVNLNGAASPASASLSESMPAVVMPAVRSSSPSSIVDLRPFLSFSFLASCRKWRFSASIADRPVSCDAKERGFDRGFTGHGGPERQFRLAATIRRCVSIGGTRRGGGGGVNVHPDDGKGMNICCQEWNFVET